MGFVCTPRAIPRARRPGSEGRSRILRIRLRGRCDARTIERRAPHHETARRPPRPRGQPRLVPRGREERGVLVVGIEGHELSDEGGGFLGRGAGFACGATFTSLPCVVGGVALDQRHQRLVAIARGAVVALFVFVLGRDPGLVELRESAGWRCHCAAWTSAWVSTYAPRAARTSQFKWGVSSVVPKYPSTGGPRRPSTQLARLWSSPSSRS